MLLPERSMVPAQGGEKSQASPTPWKVLAAFGSAADAEACCSVGRQARILGRPVDILQARTVDECRAQRDAHPDIAVALVELEFDPGQSRAGLKAAQVLRDRPGNPNLKVVLFTSGETEPGESDWVEAGLVDDFRDRSDLEKGRLYSVIYSCIRQYDERVNADETRRGIDRIVDASSTLLRRKRPDRLARGGIDLLCSVLAIDPLAEADGIDAGIVRLHAAHRVEVLTRAACCGDSESLAAPEQAIQQIRDLNPPDMGALWIRQGNALFMRMRGEAGIDVGLWLMREQALPRVPDQVIHVFCRHLCNALGASAIEQSATRAQNGLILMLSEAIEQRSMETSNHVRRVGEYSKLLGKLYGFRDEEADRLLIAAALHDAGKVAIPDAILNKPGKLSAEERAVMESHASVGARMFEGQDLPVLQAARVIAIQHHERWDGTGYPSGLRGEDIHIYGRIAGLADVFDALGSHRCYKPAWPIEDVLAFIREERGRHFDPKLVDLFLDHLGLFLEIRARYVDPLPSAPFSDA